MIAAWFFVIGSYIHPVADLFDLGTDTTAQTSVIPFPSENTLYCSSGQGCKVEDVSQEEVANH